MRWAISGYIGGKVDLAIGRLADVILSFPPIILGIVITGVLGPQTRNLVLAHTLKHVPVFLRIARSGVLTEVNLTYVEAARCLGLSDTAILFNHVLRNVLPLITMQYVVLFPLILRIQAALGLSGSACSRRCPIGAQFFSRARTRFSSRRGCRFFRGRRF